MTTECGPPRSLKLNFWPSTRISSHRSIAVAGVAKRTSDNSPAADSAAGEVEEDGHLIVMVGGVCGTRRKDRVPIGRSCPGSRTRLGNAGVKESDEEKDYQGELQVL